MGGKTRIKGPGSVFLDQLPIGRDQASILRFERTFRRSRQERWIPLESALSRS